MWCVWFASLLLCAAVFLGEGRHDTVIAALELMRLGVTAYLLLFEVWPRHMILYAPLFAVVASLGQRTLRSFGVYRVCRQSKARCPAMRKQRHKGMLCVGKAMWGTCPRLAIASLPLRHK